MGGGRLQVCTHTTMTIMIHDRSWFGGAAQDGVRQVSVGGGEEACAAHTPSPLCGSR